LTLRTLESGLSRTGNLPSEPRVLLIATSFPPVVGGASVVYENLCRQLGDRLTILTGKYYVGTNSKLEDWKEFDESTPATVYRVDDLRSPAKPRAFGLLGSAWRFLTDELTFRRTVWKTVRTIIRERQPTVAFVGDLFPLSWLALRLMRRARLPVAFYIHGEEIASKPISMMEGWESKRALGMVAGAVVPSSFTKTELAARGVAAEQIRLIPNGVDSDLFFPAEQDDELLAKHQVGGRKVLMTVARLAERKGIDKMIEAMPAILRKAPETVYLIVGSGPERSRLEALRDSLGLQRDVIFCGSPSYADVSAIVRYYQSCDIFVMPNRTLPAGETEGFGLVFLEAGACGKPVVGGRAGGAIDAIEHGESGFLVDSQSASEIADATLRLLGDPALAARMGAAGRRRAEHSTWVNRSEEFLRFSKELSQR
jgi:phosphatidyl-myo-inositol dimannoside synthase